MKMLGNFAKMAFDRERFRQQREKYGSREKLSLQLKDKPSVATLRNWEQTDISPSIDDLDRVCKEIGTTVSYIIHETDDPSPDALKPKIYTSEELEELGYQERSVEGDLADPAKMEAMHIALLREYEAAKRLREYIQRQPQRPTPKKDGG